MMEQCGLKDCGSPAEEHPDEQLEHYICSALGGEPFGLPMYSVCVQVFLYCVCVCVKVND